ncbi:MAG: gliding motility-associated C-terminal domain-containing protein [Crocinitomicaceae bacterium]
MKHLLLVSSFLYLTFLSNAQPANDNCSGAIQLCAGQSLAGTTTGATTSASEDGTFCIIPNAATVWYKFTTNATGGAVTIDFTGLTFNVDPTYGQVIEVMIYNVNGNPCTNPNTYTPTNASCASGGTDFSYSPSIALSPNTTYYLMVNGSASGVGVTNAAECDFTVSISGVAVDATFPTASISALDTILCQGDDATVETIISNCSDTASFDWYYNNVLLQSSSIDTFSTTVLADSGYLKLVINCGSYCVYSDTTDSIYFSVTPISVDAGPDKFIQDGDVVTLDGDGMGSPSWTPGNTLTSTTNFTPTANPSNTTTYFLTVTNGSCVATDSVNVFVGEVITIYSAFSPNNDNINDKWIIKNSNQYPNMEVTVYDRSGQKVFQTTGYSTSDKWWDGTNKNGKPLPVSTYFYVIDIKEGGDNGIFKGTVNIMR